MKPQLNPGWLVSLLNRWAIRSLSLERVAIGYPTKACGFSERTTGGYNHSNPVAFSAEDFRDLDTALEQLKLSHKEQFMATMMFYKPWVVESARHENWPFKNSTYYKRLHAAHSFLATQLDLMKNRVDV
jgi:hypothetical protein